jgi:hypothetical protein
MRVTSLGLFLVTAVSCRSHLAVMNHVLVDVSDDGGGNGGAAAGEALHPMLPRPQQLFSATSPSPLDDGSRPMAALSSCPEECRCEHNSDGGGVVSAACENVGSLEDLLDQFGGSSLTTLSLSSCGDGSSNTTSNTRTVGPNRLLPSLVHLALTGRSE